MPTEAGSLNWGEPDWESSRLMVALLFPVPCAVYTLRIPSFSGRPSEFTRGVFKAGPGSSCDLSICLEKEAWPWFACCRAFPLLSGIPVAWQSPQCRV